LHQWRDETERYEAEKYPLNVDRPRRTGHGRLIPIGELYQVKHQYSTDRLRELFRSRFVPERRPADVAG
jgi:hypothetical protein